MRTGLGAMASGIGAKALLEGHIANWVVTATTIVLMVFAVFCFVAGVWRQIDPRAPSPRADVRRIPAWLLVLFNGFLAIVALAVLATMLLR